MYGEITQKPGVKNVADRSLARPNQHRIGNIYSKRFQRERIQRTNPPARKVLEPPPRTPRSVQQHPPTHPPLDSWRGTPKGKRLVLRARTSNGHTDGGGEGACSNDPPKTNTQYEHLRRVYRCVSYAVYMWFALYPSKTIKVRASVRTIYRCNSWFTYIRQHRAPEQQLSAACPSRGARSGSSLGKSEPTGSLRGFRSGSKQKSKSRK